MAYEELCWEPVAALPEGEPETSFGGRWEDRLWLNVPGPFYTGIADNCWTGRLHAPRRVLYGGEHFSEYVYRQPATTAEVLNLATAAQVDPYRGYACDGDSRWTPEAVRGWWHDRGRVTGHLESLLPRWSSSDRTDEREAAEGLRDFAAYITEGLGTDLRKYLFRLEEGCYPKTPGPLPELR
ncbi:hypothetical protein CRV15_35535 (plasmid) [Streptomyces clavuligerus]|uniref:Ferredoxin n=1 Tax=Streptomyces clavuligerus TaxID=1901 RepID=B5GM10_STRCL|nr:hypothetical protein [Streptomyces clavuligerus]EDY47356.1 hypothetical protein SSCG_00384 [Streptomyces clavuligerus]EFG05011.1 Hypothetical protein SCLAV_p1530 [Streptomyces clavuligerus]MBY6306571.1 hypothetical protein [Streptomyces clavuligerus]QCS10825.1 hypothetical protein CRV15_35535 [Streptomyces clavuligerus]QPJ97138.1 hypothetical protein GE265_28940 [Streptomyces clavuligerus]